MLVGNNWILLETRINSLLIENPSTLIFKQGGRNVNVLVKRHANVKLTINIMDQQKIFNLGQGCTDLLKIVYVEILTMSLEIRPLAALYLSPPLQIYFLDWYYRKGQKCRRHEHTAPGNHWERSPIKYRGEGITLPVI